MKNFNNTRRDFRRGGGGKSQFGNRDKERPQMHEAVCSDCGKKCEVPFKPTGDKPVYCSQCFSSRRESSSSNRPERRSYERPRFQDKKMFDAVCDKCGKRFELPFRPTGSKPVYCNECFGKGGDSPNKDVEQYKEQFDMLNIKLDRIIRVLTPVAPAKEQSKDVVVEKKKEVAKKKEKAKKSKKPVDKKKKAKKDSKKKK